MRDALASTTSRQGKKGDAHDHQAWQTSARDGTRNLAKSGHEDRRRCKPKRKPESGGNQSRASALRPGIIRRRRLALAQSCFEPAVL